jgi:non-homologous end joining protein Ku
MTATMKFRQYVASPKFNIRFGPWTATGGLSALQTSAKERGEVEMHMCTVDGSGVTRQYVGPDGKPVEEEALVRYYIGEDKEKVVVGKQALEDMKESKAETLPMNEMVLTVHPLHQCAGQMYPDGSKNSWVFIPKEDSPESIGIHDNLLLMSERFAILSHVNINHHEGLFRVIAWRGHLVLQPQLFVDRVRNWPVLDMPEVEDEIFNKLEGYFDALSKDYDEEAYLDTSAARVRNVLAAAAGDQDAQKLLAQIEAKPEVPAVDLLELLDRAIAEKENA